MKNCAVVLVFIFLTHFLSAQITERFTQVRISLANTSLNELQKLGVDVEHGFCWKNQSLLVEVSADILQILKNKNIHTDIIIDDVKQNFINHISDLEDRTGAPCTGEKWYNYQTPVHYQPGSMGGYYNYEEAWGYIDEMSSLYPNLMTYKAPIGDTIKTANAHSIYFLKISDNPNVDENEPKILITAVHHAREPNSFSQLVFFMWYLLENYATDPEIQYLVDNTEIYLVPMVNPDGYIENVTTNPLGGGFWRKNKRDNLDGTFGVDLNRNYGYGWGYDDNGSDPYTDSDVYRGTEGFSEPETKAIKLLCSQHPFKIALNFHTYSNVLVQPYSYADVPNPDLITFQNYAEAYTRENVFNSGTSVQTVYYYSNGTSDDWMYGDDTTKARIIAMTPEVGPRYYGFWPPSNKIDYINKSAFQTNITALKLLHRFALAWDNSASVVKNTHAYIKYRLKRYGIENGPTLVSIEGVSNNILSVGNSKMYNLNQFEEIEDSIEYFLKPGLNNGDNVILNLAVENGGYTHRDELVKQYASLTFDAFADSGNDFSKWQNSSGSGWDISTIKFHSPPASLADSPNDNYLDGVNNLMTTKNSIDLSSAVLAKLHFWANWDIEPEFDEAILFVSTDNNSFTPVCAKYTRRGSDYQISGQPVWEGTHDWVEEEVDLHEYLGEKIWLRFNLRSDSDNTGDGIYVDDLHLEIATADSISSSANNLNDSGFQIFPNPAINQLDLEFSEPFYSASEWVILDALGRQIMRGNAVSGSKTMQIDVSGLPNGCYFIKFGKTENPKNWTNTTQKVIILH